MSRGAKKRAIEKVKNAPRGGRWWLLTFKEHRRVGVAWGDLSREPPLTLIERLGDDVEPCAVDFAEYVPLFGHEPPDDQRNRMLTLEQWLRLVPVHAQPPSSSEWWVITLSKEVAGIQALQAACIAWGDLNKEGHNRVLNRIEGTAMLPDDCEIIGKRWRDVTEGEPDPAVTNRLMFPDEAMPILNALNGITVVRTAVDPEDER